MNILLISMDTLRADRLSCYGHFRATSPHADRLASQGVLFENFYSPHIPTFPGHTCMMTGRDVYAHQITGQSGTPELSPNIPLLAEILAGHGYFTAAADNLGRWFARGFQLYEGYAWDTSSTNEWRKGEAVNQAALRVLNAAAKQDRPFFVFLHYWDPHTPYLPPAPFSRMFYEGDERDPANHSMDAVWAFENFKWYFNEWMPGVTDIEFPKAQYDAEVAYADACLAHIFTRLDELGLAEDTLVAYTSDHGEELDEHGCWFDHHGLYEPNVHIPLILRWPGVIPAGARIRSMAQMMDLTPTILDYAGLLDDRRTFEGRSLRPAIEGHPDADGCTELHLTENTWMKKRAIRTQEWKLIVALEPDLHGFPMVELYHIARDAGEKTNVAQDHPEVVDELRRRMEEHVRRRVEETGLPDPLPIQPIPLRRIGRMETAVPTEKNLAEEAPVPAADEKLPAGDFVGYEREEG
ncbi:MAG: sulfatase family protein [Chthonomonadales bacterium]